MLPLIDNVLPDHLAATHTLVLAMEPTPLIQVQSGLRIQTFDAANAMTMTTVAMAVPRMVPVLMPGINAMVLPG